MAQACQPQVYMLYYAFMSWYCLGRHTFTLITWHAPATGHITLTTTNEVVTTKTRRTTSQPTLKSTTKEAESITTTNEITSSTSSSFTSRDYMTATSSHSSSSSFTTITGESRSLWWVKMHGAMQGIFYSKNINILSLFTHPCVVPNQYDFFSSMEPKRRSLAECSHGSFS